MIEHDTDNSLFRWFLNDTVTHFTFGQPIGFVEEGRDVDGLIEALHSMAIMTGLIAALPWLFEPLIKNRFLKRFLLPGPGNRTGSGRIMAVSSALPLWSRC